MLFRYQRAWKMFCFSCFCGEFSFYYAWGSQVAGIFMSTFTSLCLTKKNWWVVQWKAVLEVPFQPKWKKTAKWKLPSNRLYLEEPLITFCNSHAKHLGVGNEKINNIPCKTYSAAYLVKIFCIILKFLSRETKVLCFRTDLQSGSALLSLKTAEVWEKG